MQSTQRYVKTGLAMTLIIAIGSVALGTVQAQELINTATNEVATVSDLGKQDLLEEIYANLDAIAQETQSTFILVEQENGSVTLFNINYPYEDYAETGIPMVELGTYQSLIELVH